MASGIIGIPNPEEYGSPETLPTGELVPWVVQRHLAEKAGPHYDIRLGKDRMFSFATKKELPKPGERISVFQQPLHEESYKTFEGRIPKGYGAGIVRQADLGEVLIADASPTKIRFIVAHKQRPQEFTLVRMRGKGASDRGASWLMLNTTPNKPVGEKKIHYRKIPAEKIDKLFDPDYVMSHKIDGAAAFAKLMKNHVDVMSYRTSASGEPIIHTYRMGLERHNLDIPKELQGKLLRGEIWGEREGRAISPQELGGILNSVVSNSIRRQRESATKLRMALFGVKDTPESEYLPIGQSREIIQKALKHLPQDVFHEPAYATSLREKQKMWKRIEGELDPVTSEGVVGFPVGGGVPSKVKLVDDYDVYVREVFPGAGKYSGKAAGGFRYSLTPDGPIVGEVGSGFSDKTRKDLFNVPDRYIGRLARVKAQEMFPSGALRAPSFIALHEDYPNKRQA